MSIAGIIISMVVIMCGGVLIKALIDDGDSDTLIRSLLDDEEDDD